MLRRGIAFLVVLKLSVISAASLKRVETASNGIAQILDFCSDKYSINFKLVVVGDHPDLFKIAGKVLKLSNSSSIYCSEHSV